MAGAEFVRARENVIRVGASGTMIEVVKFSVDEHTIHAQHFRQYSF